jgi:hypothetical protein
VAGVPFSVADVGYKSGFHLPTPVKVASLRAVVQQEIAQGPDDAVRVVVDHLVPTMDIDRSVMLKLDIEPQ